MFAFAGAGVAVRSAVPGVLPWLREFLVPGFATLEDRSDRDMPLVRILADQAAPMPWPLEPVPWVALDAGIDYAPGARVGHGIAVQSDHWRTRQDVHAGGVDIAGQQGDARLGLAAMRTVRELALVQSLRPGDVELHAACVQTEGRTIVLAGPKRAGKTTLVSRLASVGAGIVANDRVILRPSGPGWEVMGVPSIVSVRRGTLRLLPDLFTTVPRAAHCVDLTLADAKRASLQYGTHRRGPLVLSPAQHAEQAGGRRVVGGSLAAIVVVSYESTLPDFSLEPMSMAQARDALPDVLFGAADALPSPTVLGQRFGRRDRAGNEGGAVAAGAAWWRLQVGPDVVRSPPRAGRLLDALTELG